MTAPLLEITDIGKSFGGLRALDAVGFSMPAGQIRGLIGPNGAGKTTLLNIISGHDRSDQGGVALAGHRLAPGKPHAHARAGLARTFQSTRLFAGLSVIENVMVGCHAWTRAGYVGAALRLGRMRAEERAIRDAAMQALHSVGIAHAAGQRPEDLPYGHQRLLDLARALAGRPKLLLLDEPAAGLNPAEVRHLAALLRRVPERGIGLLIVEHNVELVMHLCQAITVLSFGRKIADGAPEAIRADPEVRRVYLGDDRPAAH